MSQSQCQLSHCPSAPGSLSLLEGRFGPNEPWSCWLCLLLLHFSREHKLDPTSQRQGSSHNALGQFSPTARRNSRSLQTVLTQAPCLFNSFPQCSTQPPVTNHPWTEVSNTGKINLSFLKLLFLILGHGDAKVTDKNCLRKQRNCTSM